MRGGMYVERDGCTYSPCNLQMVSDFADMLMDSISSIILL